MSSKNSKIYILSKKYPFLKKFYFFYNIYIRNLKFYFNGSQFQEDKKILRLFDKNYRGRYVDLGCFHPTRVNNTFKMYKQGWNGMNIDLNPLTIELFNFARPNDVNICSAISNKEAKKKLYFLGDLDPKNTLNDAHKKWLNKEFRISNKDIKSKSIKTQRFDKILEQNNFIEFDFLNIDIEGHELEVLQSLNFKKFKIEVICVEILDYDKSSNLRKKKLIKFLKKNKYRLVEKSTVNYIFKRQNK